MKGHLLAAAGVLRCGDSDAEPVLHAGNCAGIPDGRLGCRCIGGQDAILCAALHQSAVPRNRRAADCHLLQGHAW